jgi:fatty-acyl-CoA synthase
VPRYVEFVDDFPMTITGKIQKYLMRDEMTQRLGY